MSTDSLRTTICESTAKAKVRVSLAIFFALLVALASIPAQALAEDTSEQITVPDGQVQLVKWSRLSGESRIDTMAAISAEGFDSADTVVIANSNNFPDALSATALAGYYNAPILLTSPDALDSKAASEIERLGAKKAIIIGGEAAISPATASQINQISSVTSVDRISGTDRFKTSEEIYNAGKKVGAWDKASTKTAIIVSGVGFADALSMSPYAYAKGAPIFLADSEGSLTSESAQAIANGGFKQVIIAGGESVVSESTQSAMENIVGKSNVTRLAGGSRYETSAKIADWSIENGLSYEGAAFATGNSFPDGLAGGALCGSRSSVLMLVSEDELSQADNAYTPATDALAANKAVVKKANILGGTGVVSTGLYQKLQTATLEYTSAQTNQNGEATVANKDLASVDLVVKYGDKDAPLKGATVKANDDGSYSIALPEDSDVEKVEVTLVDSATGEPVKEGVKVSATNSKGVDRGTVQTSGSTGTVTFKGGAIDFSNAYVDSSAKTYNGKEQTTTVEIPGLVENKDFKVTYQDNKNAGTALLTVEGIGTHTGSKTYKFKINPADLTKATIALDETKLVYNGKTQEQAIKSIVLDGLVLNEGTDFTVDKNTAAEAGDYELLIAAKGNYTGNVFKSWTVEKASIDFTNVEIDETTKVYNGSEITTSIEGMPEGLEEGKDYTVTYTNNINAGIAKVTIEGTGNYQGSKNGTYMINKASLQDAELELDSTEFVYNKEDQAPTVKRVVVNGRVLAEGTDYNVVCDKKANVGEGYTLTIEATADGNYTGSANETWSITPAELDFSKVSLKDADNYVYDGDAKTPTVEGLDKYTTEDYDVTYADNKDAGTATVTVKGKGNYSGEKVLEFNIAQVSLDDAVVTLSAESFDYAKDKTRIVNVSSVELDGESIGVENYTVSGTRSEVNAGTYKVTVEGIGNYKGSASATWTINPLDISKAYTITLVPSQSEYTGESIEPEVEGLTGLVKDEDYTVEYTNNVNAAKADAEKAPTAIIKAISNNYTGTVSKTFEIAPVSLEKAEIYLDNAEFVYTGSKQAPKVKEVVLDGKVLKEGDDYTLDKNNAKENAGEYKFTIYGTGNYKADSSATADWKIKSIDNILENVTLDVSADGATYTGSEITPEVQNVPSEIGNNYTVEYKNNIGVGVATATITCTDDNYTGTKTIEFKIVPADIQKAIVKLDDQDLTYKFENGAAVEQTKGVDSVKMSADAGALVVNEDYIVSGNIQTDAGSYELTVAGTGNYTGTVTVPWTINAAKASTDAVALKIEGTYTYSGNAYEPSVIGMPAGPVLGKDYQIAYSNNINATTDSQKAIATITFKGNYAATDAKVLEFNIAPQDISAAHVYLNTIEELVYKPKIPQTQGIDEVVLGSKVLTNNTDYVVTGNTGTDAGSYKLRVEGTGNYTGYVDKEWSISPAELDLTNVSLSQQQWTYIGLPREPEVIGLDGYTIEEDYKVTYENNTEVGIATATIEGINNYTGKTALGFIINPEGTPKNISLAKVVINNTPSTYETTFNAGIQNVSAKVTLDDKELVEDTDYEVVEGSSGYDAGTYTYKIVGKNNYTGINTSASWIIKPATLDQVELVADELEYTGEEQTVEIKTVTFSDASITGDPQYYNVSGNTATNVIDHTEAKSEIGEYILTVTPNGSNYTGSASTTWKITPKSIANTTPEGKAEVQLNPTELVYDGSQKTQNVDKVILGKKVLTAGTEYIVSDNQKSNVNTTGNYELKVTGTGNYKDEVTANWNISPRDISNATLSLSDTTYTYKGSEQGPEPTVIDGGNALTQLTDYTIDLEGSKGENAGNYTYKIEGAGNYTGTTSADWEIQKASIEDLTFTLDPTSLTYDGDPKEPKVIAPTGLTPNEDYTVSYSNNVEAAQYSDQDAPTVTIKGTGNYEGTVEKKFTISPINLNQDKIEFYLDQTEFVYEEDAQGIAKEFSPKIQRVLFDGKLLTEHKDYEVVSEGSKGSALGGYKYTIQGIGNYANTAFTEWNIKSADAVLDDVTLDVSANGATYTGSEIKPEVLGVEAAQKIGKIDGWSVEYENNVNVGVATATITCTGNYTGTKIIQFNIVPKSLDGGTVNLDAVEKDYTGFAQTVNVQSVVDDEGNTVAEKYYDVSGNTETNVARTATGEVTTYTVTVTGKDNYTGTATATWTINPLSIEDGSYELESTTYTYNEQKQTVGVKTVTTADGSKTLGAGDYELSGDTTGTDARIYNFKIAGVGNYTGEINASWTIDALSIRDAGATVELDPTKLVYDSSTKTQNVAKVILGNKILDATTDYTVDDNTGINVSTEGYTLTVEGKGNYRGSVTAEWNILPAELDFANVALDPDSYTYDGDEKEPTVKNLDDYTPEDDYTVTYANNTNAGTATATIEGKGNYTGTKVLEFTIAPASIEDAVVVIEDTENGYITTYSGSEQEVDATVTLGNKALVEDADYTVVSGDKGTDVDTYTYTIEGTGNYTGTTTANWKICPLSIEGGSYELDPATYTYNEQKQTVGVKTVKTADGSKTLGAGDYELSGDTTGTDARIYNFKIAGVGNYTGEINASWTIDALSIRDAGATVELDPTKLVYDSSTKTQNVAKVILGNKILDATTDYTVDDNTGINVSTEGYTLTVEGKGNYRGSVTAEWNILPAELDFANVALDPDSYTYDGDEKEPTVKNLDDYTPEDDYTVTYANNTNAGTATATIEGQGNYTGTKVLEFTINPIDITEAVLTVDTKPTDATYTGSDITASVKGATLNGTALPDGSYTSTDSTKTDAGTYTISITAVSPNYTGSASTTWTIAQADLSDDKVPTDLTTTAKRNQTLAEVELPTLPDGYDGTLEWTGPDTTVSDKVQATYTPKDTNYKSITVDVLITFENPTIVYHSNGATSGGTTSADGDNTYKQTGTFGQNLKLQANGFSKAPGNVVYGMTYWTTNEDGTGDVYTDRQEVVAADSLLDGGTVDLYAQWTDKVVGSYWIAAAKSSTTSDAAPVDNEFYTNPVTSVLKTQYEIVEDMRVLHGTQSQTSDGRDYNTVLVEYDDYMSNDNYHLYSNWTGTDTEVDENKYVEFRIVQTGEHLNDSTDEESGDGSVVTFMATHSLPTGKAIYPPRKGTTDGGWSTSNMRTSVIPSYVADGLGDLASAAKTITKKAMAGTSSSWETDATVQDSIWLMSYSEIYGENGECIDDGSGYYCAKEGSQYEWFEEKVNNTGYAKNNPAISGIEVTRNGENPNGSSNPNWYLRSFSQYQTGYPINWCNVTKDGAMQFRDNEYVYGVVPCFAF